MSLPLPHGVASVAPTPGAPPAGPLELTLSSRRGRRVLAVTVLGSGLASLDATVVSIALPSIGRSFHAGVAQLQWVANGYLLTLAGLLLLGGVLGDRYGRRRVFTIGVAWFAGASALCAMAPSAGVLLAARALQGVGGALLAPGSLAILQASFAREDRSRAIGAWSGLGGIAGAIGPFIGGYLIDAVSWRLIFLINLPVAAALVVVSPRIVPESRDPAAPDRVDVLGGLLATAGLVGLTYGLIEGPPDHFGRPFVAGALIEGVGALVAFVLTELRHEHPLLPIEVFSSRQFVATNAVTFLIYGALGATFFLLPVELEQVGAYTPLEAGASLLPLTALMLVLSPRFGALATRIGPRWLMSAGPLIAAVGLAAFSRIGPHASYAASVLPAVLFLGLGLSVTVAPLTSTVLSAAPGAHSGAASAINNDVARTAGLLAIAVLPAAVGLTGRAYLEPSRFNAGFHTAVLCCAGACAFGGLLSSLTVLNPRAEARRSRSVAKA